MLDIKLIRENPDLVKKSILRRGKDPATVDKLLEVDREKRELIKEIDDLKASRNQISGKPGKEELKKLKEVKELIDNKEQKKSELEEIFTQILKNIPNLLADDVPDGKSEEENQVLKEFGKIPEFDFTVKDHEQLGKELDIIDTVKSAEISGARFSYLKGKLVLMQFALIQHTLNVLTNEKILAEIAADNNLKVKIKPFTAVIPPVLVKEDVLDKMGRLEPKDDRYQTTMDNMYLVGSAEHSLGSYHLDEIIPESKLPLRYAGYSTSFRREAGSYGKDMNGIFRRHQFDKLELEVFSVPEEGKLEQDFLVAIQQYLLNSLKLPFRTTILCTGDMGDMDMRQIDMETWLPGQGKYRETHTSDYMSDYQARRLNTRVKRDNGEKQFVHMNDATAFAIGRVLIAIVENYQRADGSIEVPEVLQKYTGFTEIRN